MDRFLPFFDTHPPLRGHFLYPERGHKQIFWPPPPHSVHTVIEWPLRSWGSLRSLKLYFLQYNYWIQCVLSTCYIEIKILKRYSSLDYFYSICLPWSKFLVLIEIWYSKSQSATYYVSNRNLRRKRFFSSGHFMIIILKLCDAKYSLYLGHRYSCFQK